MIGGPPSEPRLVPNLDPDVRYRIRGLAILLVVFFAILQFRLFQLQIVEGADLRDRSVRNSVRTQVIEASRGDIVDREGRLLATSRPAFRVGVVPNDMVDPDHLVAGLGLLLKRDPAELRARIGEPRGRERFRAVILESDLDPLLLARLESHAHVLPGVFTEFVPRRRYLNDVRAAHVLGTIGEVTPEQLEVLRAQGYKPGEIIGQTGLEARFETHLRGRAGGRNVVVDVAGREIEALEEIAPVPGGRLKLTLDLDLQRVAEEGFRGPDRRRSGALVALDPRNGEVLALVSMPDYDPNTFAGRIESERWERLANDEGQPLQNRVASGQYAPGSIYKAVVAAAALAEGTADPKRKIYCPGSFSHGGRVYHCWNRAGHGHVDLLEALARSCDVYFYRLGLELGIDRLARYARAFGLGEATGSRIAGEKSGLVPTRAWKQRVKNQPWQSGETLSAAIGQGFNLATPLQLAVLYASLANGGVRVRPRLVMRLETWDGRLVEEGTPTSEPVPGVDARTMDLLKRALVQAVEAPQGTGWRARVPGVEVAGKTGTTQVVSLETLRGLEGGEIPDRYRDHALFAAFAPADDPEIMVLVLVEHGESGGRVAAPMAQRVLARYFEKQQSRLTRLAEGSHAAN
ncbi:MAG: penicillin-binding protein 2 [Myxococcota bacterium]